MKPCDIWKYAGTVWLCNHRVEAVDMFQMADWISGNKNETFHVTSQPLDILYNSTQMMYTRRNQFETVSTSLIDTVLLDIVRESSKTFSLKTQPLLVYNYRTNSKRDDVSEVFKWQTMTRETNDKFRFQFQVRRSTHFQIHKYECRAVNVGFEGIVGTMKPCAASIWLQGSWFCPKEKEFKF